VGAGQGPFNSIEWIQHWLEEEGSKWRRRSFNSIEWIQNRGLHSSTFDTIELLSIPLNGFGPLQLYEVVRRPIAFNSIEWIRYNESREAYGHHVFQFH